MTDCSEAIIAEIKSAAAQQKTLYICGGDSKRQLLGRDCAAQTLDVSGHSGITDYQPTELVLSARGGTPLADIQAALAQEGQMLPFEPPMPGAGATLGGTVACNLSGPARPWAGAARDLVLGIQLIDGQGQQLNFGGKVMKNVAGYDVARLQAGALGTLGVLSEISLKVLPLTEHSLTLIYEMAAAEAIVTMNQRAGQSGPLSGACWSDGKLHLRLSGAASAVAQTAKAWGGEQLVDDAQFWRALKDMDSAFFQGPQPLWRLSVKSSAADIPGLGPALIDWGGAQRWLRGEHDLHALQRLAAAAGGNVNLFRGGDRNGQLRPDPDPVTRRLHERLKHTFDPLRLFNPGRLYDWL